MGTTKATRLFLYSGFLCYTVNMTDDTEQPTTTPEAPLVGGSSWIDKIEAPLNEIIGTPTVESLRAAEVARIDVLINALWKPATRGSLGAVDRVIKLSERKAKLLGLDAASAVDMTFKRMTDAELTDYISREIAGISASDSTS